MMKVKNGIERIDEFSHLFAELRVGLITNPTGVASDFTSSIKIMKEKTNLVALFAPEHGVRANIQAGIHVDNYFDEEFGLLVYSLYGVTRMPTKEMLAEIDCMAFDIQDCGSRFYTYAYTMAYSMIACAKHNKKFVVFDRPNPLGGIEVEGNELDLKYRSFVGYYPTPQRHGLTVGELALLFNNEYGINCQLEVIPMQNWERWMSFEDTILPWIVPSPNLPTINACYTYNTTCVFEGTSVEEGRGTTTPFELVGAPWINSERLAERLNEYGLPGVYFRPQWFIPTFGKYPKQMCGGVYVHVTDRKSFKMVKTSWMMIDVIWKMYPEKFRITPPTLGESKSFFELETGCHFIMDQSLSLSEQWEVIERDTKKFKKTREKYLIY